MSLGTAIETRPFAIDKVSYVNAIWFRRFGRRVAIAGGLYLCLAIGFGLASGSALTGFILGGILIVILLALIAARYLIAKRNVANPKNAVIYGERVMRFTDETVSINHVSGISSTVPWGQVVVGEESGSFYFLFLTGIQHFILPKNVFQNAADRSAFETLLKQKTGIKKMPVF